MHEVAIGVHLGHSDHKVFKFKIFGDRRKTDNKTSAPGMGRTDMRLCKELVGKVSWVTVFERIGVHLCWSVLKYW